MQFVNLDHSAIIQSGGICAYSATTGAPIANTLNRSSWAHLGEALLFAREQLPAFPSSLSLAPSQIASFPTLSEAIFLAWPIWADRHWGHFLIEEVSLLWLVLGPNRFPAGCTLILPGYARSGVAPIRARLERNYELCFTDELTDHLLVKRLWSPVPSMFEGGPLHPSHFVNVVDVLRELDPSLQPPDHPDWLDASLPSRVYLSRSALPASARRVQAEQQLETILSRAGWQILHPEKLSLKAQIRYLLNAHEVAGTLGSALHTLMYLGRYDEIACKKRVTILTSAALRCLEPTFRVQLEAQGFSFRFVDCMQPFPFKAVLPLQPWDSQFRFSLDLDVLAELVCSGAPSEPSAALLTDPAAEPESLILGFGDVPDAVKMINVNRLRLLSRG